MSLGRLPFGRDLDEIGRDRTPPRASRHLGRPEVCPTSGITGPALARGALITVMPEVGPTPLRARATVLITLLVTSRAQRAAKVC